MIVTPTSAVPYYWTNYDRIMGTLHGSVTPYDIPAEKLNESWTYPTYWPVKIPLGASKQPGAVQRFFREGYEWVPVPKEVNADTLLALLPKLYEFDKIRFAHFDPLLVTATAAHRNIERVKRLTHSSLDVTANNALPPDPAVVAANQFFTAFKASMFVADLMPFEDLVRLHFEYWGNSQLRAAWVNSMVPAVGTVKTDLFAIMPFFQALSQLLAKVAFGVPDMIPLAWTAPTTFRDAKLEYVLARKAVAGVPIRTPGTKVDPVSTGTTIKVFSLPPPRIELDGFATQELLPFHLKEWKTSSSKLVFRVTISAPVQRTMIEIVHQRAVIYRESKDGGEFIVPGVHLWRWDGYDDNGIYDTIRMKDGLLEARVTTVDMFGRVSVGRTKIRGGPGALRWVDARLDRIKKTVEATVYVHFRNPSDVEVTSFTVPVPKPLAQFMTGAMQSLSGLEGNLAPLLPLADEIPDVATLDGLLDEVPVIDMFKAPSVSEMLNKHAATFALNLPDLADLSPESFARHKGHFIDGIAYHWTRPIRIDGEVWQLAAGCRERPVDCIPVFLTKGVSNGAVNLATIQEGLPIILWDSTDVDDWRSTGAHEFGHSVLREAYDPVTSATHKGTTSVVGADPDPADVLADEIDVMYYRRNSKDGVTLPSITGTDKLIIAIEDDARALVWLARVVFG